MDGGKVLECHAALRLLGRLEVHRVDAHQGKVLFAFLGLAYLARDGVAHLQVVTADDVLADVDVVRAREVVVVGVTEETVAAFRNDFQDAFGVDGAILAGDSAQDAVHEGLLAHALEVLDAEFLGALLQFEHREPTQLTPLGACGGHFLRVGRR